VIDLLAAYHVTVRDQQAKDLLEHPDEAFASYRNEGILTVFCEQKHMGSPAVVVLCRNENVSTSRFSVVKP
jgi:protein phosphatase